MIERICELLDSSDEATPVVALDIDTVTGEVLLVTCGNDDCDGCSLTITTSLEPLALTVLLDSLREASQRQTEIRW